MIALIAEEAGKVSTKIPLSDATEQSSYFVARMFMDCCHWILKTLGLSHDTNLFIWLYVGVVLAFSILIGSIVQWILVFILNKLQPHIKSPLYGHLVEKKFFTKTCRIIPPLVFLILVQFTLYMHSSLASWMTRLSFMYIVIEVAIALSTICDVIWVYFDEKENKRKLPLRGIVQVIKLVIWIIAVIIIAALFLDKSPATLLAGLGAFAAVLMLVFKDSILGIVAGVQLAQNDSLHVGDWISVPNSQANGIVDEVSLTDVKIINWDKTISTVPPYTLITSGFKNFRNMQQSKTRRIQRSYMIDADSVVPTTEDMLKTYMQIPLIKDWIAKKIEQRDAGREQCVNNSEGLVDGTIETNLGIFRAYMKLYLDKNPYISHVDDCFVTTLQQTAYGIPLQIYCFTNTSSWFPYEGIQASIFEHLAAMLHMFGLYTYESASGRDTIIEGSLSAGRTTAPIVGIPYPYYYGSGTPADPGTPPEGLYPGQPGATQTAASQPAAEAAASPQAESKPSPANAGGDGSAK